MRIAIMQPYFFPYLGYYQLAANVDKFIFYDDVQYIKNGWINRNRILINGEIKYLTVPLQGASPNKKICDITVAPESMKWKKKLHSTIQQAYARSDYPATGLALIERATETNNTAIAEISASSVTLLLSELGAQTTFKTASLENYNCLGLSGQDRVLDICRKEGATTYINLPGGQSVYNTQEFKKFGIKLMFIEPRFTPYRQISNEFIPGLSMLDMVMSISKTEINKQLSNFDLGE